MAYAAPYTPTMGSGAFPIAPLSSVELLDSGDGRKLERFGPHVLDRPDPQALWRRSLPEAVWRAADLVFERESDRGGLWRTRGGKRLREPEGWKLELREGSPAALWIRPTPFKHVGLFPEQAANWSWVAEQRPALGERPKLLNLFGYTGAASLMARLAGYDVTHVDASRTTLAWLKENAAASGLGERDLRLVLEDAPSYVKREARRGASYAGILLDPPHYGRGPKGQKWQFESDMARLLSACGQLLEERAFLVLSTYAIGYSPLAFENVLSEPPVFSEGSVEAGELALQESEREDRRGPARRLPCGFCVRWSRGLEV